MSPIVGQTVMVSASGDLDAASVIDGFLKKHPRGELRLGTGYASAYGLAWLHRRTRRRSVQLLIGDLRTGFVRPAPDVQEEALAFLSRGDVSVRGCHAPDGMLHKKVWVALDPDGSGRPSGVLVGSANLTKAGLHKNDETVARAAPEEHQRIHDDLVQSMRRSWDAKDELRVRLGRYATDIDEPLRRERGRAGMGAGRRAVLRFAGITASVLALFVVLLVVLPWLVGVVLDRLTDAIDPAQDPAEDSSVTVADASPPVVDNAAATTIAPTATQAAATQAATASEPPLTSVAPTVPEPTTVTSAALEVPEPDPVCPYALPDGGDACSLLETLGGVDLVPCDSLPLEARPLRLTGDANPAGYAVAHDAPDLVCTWIDVGTFVAGETIPAGDLRAVNATVHGSGACRFEVYDQTGAVVVSRADYELQGWVSYALLRLHPGTTITTSGCGWVPAEHAGLGPGPDRVIGAAQHAGRRYPLIVGVDVPPTTVLIECDFWAWPDAQPDENGSWADALPRRVDERRAPGHYRAETGIIWPKC